MRYVSIIGVHFDQTKLSMFYNIQRKQLTFGDKIRDIQWIDKAQTLRVVDTYKPYSTKTYPHLDEQPTWKLTLNHRTKKNS